VRTVALVVLALAATLSAQIDTVDVEVKRSPRDKAWVTEKTRVLAGDLPAVTPKLSRYGGNLDERFDAAGFFRTHRRPDGRWTLVDPDGYAFLSIGVNAVEPNPTRGGVEAMNKLYRDEPGWARATATFLRECGFNTLACWSDYDTFRAHAPMPYTTRLSLMSEYGKLRGGTFQKPGHTGYPNDCIFVFDEQFEPFAMKRAAEILGPTKDDPYCVGHFSDNELPLWKGALGRFRQLPPNDPGKLVADAWWNNRRGDKDREPNDEDDDAFLEFVSETYYRICAKAIKAADPNHLYLGSRLLGTSARKHGVLRGCAKYVDVLSVNYYYAWSPDRRLTASWLEHTGKPYLITEWYAKGVDSGMGNASGAGWLVKTQADRGRFYQNFTLGLLDDPGCVGWHWFKYIDNDPANLDSDPSNRDSNKGLVTNRYQPYEPLIEQVKALNARAYERRDTPPATRPAR
jgi:hypothetical protein